MDAKQARTIANQVFENEIKPILLPFLKEIHRIGDSKIEELAQIGADGFNMSVFLEIQNEKILGFNLKPSENFIKTHLQEYFGKRGFDTEVIVTLELLKITKGINVDVNIKW
jgi:hypothetical protein